MGLASGFVLGREWRGSLIASMIAHGTSNGIILMISLAILGGDSCDAPAPGTAGLGGPRTALLVSRGPE